MAHRKPSRTEEWLLAHAEVMDFDFAASFGAGQSDRWRREPWYESVSVEIRGKFIDFDYKGINGLALSLYGEPRFHDPEYRVRMMEEPLKSAGLLQVNQDVLRASSFIPLHVFNHVCSALACGRLTFIQLNASKLTRRRATIRSLRFTTDRSELE